MVFSIIHYFHLQIEVTSHIYLWTSYNLQLTGEAELFRTDHWMRSRLSTMVKQCNESFDSLQLYNATKALHTYWWRDFCDIYLVSYKSH